ncbi:MAG: helix-turn-helix domain-containing protein [Solirubrobacterales bacterium]
MPDISPSQCRAARALLGWSQDQLREASGVAKVTIADFERGARARSPYADTLKRLVEAFAAAGVEFIGAGEDSQYGGQGVRLKGE